MATQASTRLMRRAARTDRRRVMEVAWTRARTTATVECVGTYAGADLHAPWARAGVPVGESSAVARAWTHRATR